MIRASTGYGNKGVAMNWNLQGGCPDEPQGFYTDRASDRGRDHRHFGRDRDSEVREYEGEGVSRLDEVGSAESDYGRRGVFRRLGEVHDGDRRGWSAVRDDQRRGWPHHSGDG